MTDTPEHQVSISLDDFMTLLRAAEFGVLKADGFKAVSTVRAWIETVARLKNMPLPDGRTQEERNTAFIDSIHDEVARYGSN